MLFGCVQILRLIRTEFSPTIELNLDYFHVLFRACLRLVDGLVSSLFMACLEAILYTVLWASYMSHLASRIKSVIV